MSLNLEIARGLAALSVFLFHIRHMLAESAPWLAELSTHGYLGVYLFFVVSGYVITSSAEGVLRHNASPHQFINRRFLRIYPPFWASIVVAISVPLIIATLKGQDFQPKFGDYRIIEWVQLATLSKVFVGADVDLFRRFSDVNAIYWTLAIEFQFYCVVYVALCTRRFFRSILLAVTVVSIWLIIWPSAFLNSGLFIHYWPMFAIGIILYYATNLMKTKPGMARPLKMQVSGLFLTLFSAGALVWFDIDSYFQNSNLVVTIFFSAYSALLLFLAIPFEKRLIQWKSKGRILGVIVSFGAFLGTISYSLYLLHTKISILAALVFRQFFPTDDMVFPMIVVATTIAVSAIFHVVFEKPFMSANYRRMISRL